MPEFLQLVAPEEGLARFLSAVTVRVSKERLVTAEAGGRILAEAIAAPESLPAFSRSAVDGYAVRSADTFGASDSAPAYLMVAGEVVMGALAEIGLDRGQCVAIHTGGMIPPDADAVLMLEYTQQVGAAELECYRAVATGENVILQGEDIQGGETIFQPGDRLGPAEIGGLMALGITHLVVRTRPVIGILSTGDEVVAPDQTTGPGQVRDVNTYALSTLVTQHGGVPKRLGIAGDEPDVIENMAREGLAGCDALVITAGSSASVRDLTAHTINRLGSPGVLVHGLNVRPGKPTLLGVCDGKPVVGLPGNPVSALIIGMLVLPKLLDSLMEAKPAVTGEVTARLRGNLPSQAGREEFVPVRLFREDDKWVAEPVFGKSNLIFVLVRADGLAHIPADVTGISTGETINVKLIVR